MDTTLIGEQVEVYDSARRNPCRGRRCEAVVWLAAAGFALALSYVGYVRYGTFRAGVDEGVFMQIVYSAATGFHSTVEGDFNHLAVHFSPILFLLAPLTWLTRSGLTLAVIQACALALIGPPLFLIGRANMPAALAAAAACVALAYPPLLAMATGDFHELAFAPAATLWLIWAIHVRRWWVASIFAACALAIKEDELLLIAFLATLLAVRAWRKRDAATLRFSAGLLAVSIALFSGYFLILRPAVAHGLPYWSLHFYDWNSTLVSPLGYAPVASPVRFWYLWWAVVPLAGICFASPAILLALPGAAEVMLSHESIALNLSTHYVATWLPYVLLAYVLGIARLSARAPGAAWAAVAISALLTIWTDAYANPSSFWHHKARQPDAHDRVVQDLIDTLPAVASVGTSFNIFAHLGTHPSAGLKLAGPRYILVDRTCDSSYCTTDLFPRVDRIVASGGYRLARRSDGVELYERGPQPEPRSTVSAATWKR